MLYSLLYVSLLYFVYVFLAAVFPFAFISVQRRKNLLVFHNSPIISLPFASMHAMLQGLCIHSALPLHYPAPHPPHPCASLPSHLYSDMPSSVNSLCPTLSIHVTLPSYLIIMWCEIYICILVLRTSSCPHPRCTAQKADIIFVSFMVVRPVPPTVCAHRKG